MNKTRVINNHFAVFRRFKNARILLIVGLLLFGSLSHVFPATAASCSSALDCQQQISNLNNQNTQAQQSLGTLQTQASSYQATVDQLQSQISTVQAAIGANQTKQAALQQQIQSDNSQIAEQKQVLGAYIRSIYLNGQMSTVEELATSKNLSDFVDAETYRNAIQSQVQTLLTQITQLENQQQQQQTQVSQLLQTQQAQQTQLSSAENQQSQLLSYDNAQQTQYNQQITTNSANVAQLDAQLTELNNAGSSTVISSGVCGGGYPAKAVNPYYPGDGFGEYWGCNYPQDGSEDNWHMENRECVSYTAYMAHSLYGVSTNNWGNAYQWITAAENAGFVVDQTPAVGAIAIRDRDYSVPGDVGHAMYVVAVNGSDNITVDEYNESYNGQFDERSFSPSSYDSRGGLYYIHFQ
ncbi:MAG TPA: CHAP domain-containing protein [Candidatus Binatia bacterium]|nr:CHAP domain-containing protein [Candidatus Binatia bacterium]